MENFLLHYSPHLFLTSWASYCQVVECEASTVQDAVAGRNQRTERVHFWALKSNSLSRRQRDSKELLPRNLSLPSPDPSAIRQSFSEEGAQKDQKKRNLRRDSNPSLLYAVWVGAGGGESWMMELSLSWGFKRGRAVGLASMGNSESPGHKMFAVS